MIVGTLLTGMVAAGLVARGMSAVAQGAGVLVERIVERRTR